MHSLLPIPLKGQTVALCPTQKMLHRLGFVDQRHQQAAQLLEIGAVASRNAPSAVGHPHGAQSGMSVQLAALRVATLMAMSDTFLEGER